jgi:type I restriction enzyme S subunit
MINQIKLKTIADIITGFPFKGDQYSDDGIRTVRGENVTEGNLRWDTIKCWNQKFDKEEEFLLKTNDVVIGMDGSKVGKNKARIKEIDLPLLLAQRVACVRSKKNNDQIFLYYLINNPRFEDYVFKTQTGSSVPHISKSQIEDYVVPEIKYEEQQRIAAVLSVLDDKISLNNRINAELEAMAKTLYDYWFVQFDFPNEVGKPYKSSGGKMVWNEELKREVPEGWKVDIVDSVLSELTKGFTTEYVEKSNLINLNQKVNRGFSLERQYFKYLDENIEIPAQKYAKEKDILINSLGQGTLGRVHFFCEKAKNIVVDQHIFILRTNPERVTPVYLYLLLTSKAYQIQIGRQITGSTGMQMLNASNLKDIDIIIPKLELMRQFEKSVYPFFEKVVVNDIENQQLSSLRDWLLPMLMNGQVRVGNTSAVLSTRVEEVGGLMAAEPREMYGV